MDVDKHTKAEENIKIASLDLGRHCTDTVVYKLYVQKPWPMFACCDVKRFFKEDVGTSLKPS